MKGGMECVVRVVRVGGTMRKVLEAAVGRARGEILRAAEERGGLGFGEGRGELEVEEEEDGEEEDSGEDMEGGEEEEEEEGEG